jgi:hypothetical protein
VLPTGKTSPFQAAKMVLVTLVAIAVVIGPAVALTGDVRVTSYGVAGSAAFAGVEEPKRALSGQVTLTVHLDDPGNVVHLTSATPSGKTIDSARVGTTETSARLQCNVRGFCVIRAVVDGETVSEIVVDVELKYLPDYGQILPTVTHDPR